MKRPLPEFVGLVTMKLQAKSDAAYRELLRQFLGFYAAKLQSSHWGEVATLKRGNLLDVGIDMVRRESHEGVKDSATTAVDDRLIDLLLDVRRHTR